MTEYRLPGRDNWANMEVVGEYYRESEIIRALGRKPRIDEDLIVNTDALLVPEPDNPFGKKAISVRINGNVVGYLATDDAEDYWNVIGRITASGHTAVTKARIWATYRRSWDGKGKPEFKARISIALGEPHLLCAVNNPPARPHGVLPWGNRYQVTKEQDHFDVLFNYVPTEGAGFVLVTLHRATRTLKNGTERQFVEVRVDGERVGEMSPTTSQNFLPVIEHMDTIELQTVAWAAIDGSSLAAQLVLLAAKSTEIPDEWLNEGPNQVPVFVEQSDHYELPPAYTGQPGKPKKVKPKKTEAPRAVVEEQPSVPQKPTLVIDPGSHRPDLPQPPPQQQSAPQQWPQQTVSPRGAHQHHELLDGLALAGRLIAGLVAAVLLLVAIILFTTGHPVGGVLCVLFTAGFIALAFAPQILNKFSKQ